MWLHINEANSLISEQDLNLSKKISAGIYKYKKQTPHKLAKTEDQKPSISKSTTTNSQILP